MPPKVSSSLAAGQIFHGRYQIVRCLKSGGMGAVYECIHLKTRKHRALKVMLPEIVTSESMRERFELEARVTADIESEHIVETFDAGVDEETGAPFLVMELLRGEELGSLLKRRGALPFEEVVLLLSQAALALDRTHAAGIVHRDLKPDNLFVTSRDDGAPRLKILDFGVAKVVADEARSIQPTAAIGTPLYMSPEQFQGDGKIGPRADIYALGHIAYALLTGRPYWYDEQRSTPAVFAFFVLVMAGPPERPSKRASRRGVTLPSGFDAWFARATARVPRDRFDSASALVTDLAAVLEVTMPRFTLTSSPPRLSSSPPRASSSSPSLSSPAEALTGATRVDAPRTAQKGQGSTRVDAPKTAQETRGSTRVDVPKTVQKTRGSSFLQEGTATAVDPAPMGGLEHVVTSTLPNLTRDSTAADLPSNPRPSRLRMVFLVPVAALVIWIGVTVLLRVLAGGSAGSAPASAASAVSITADPRAAAAARAPGVSTVTAAPPPSVPSAPILGPSAKPSPEKPRSLLEPPKHPSTDDGEEPVPAPEPESDCAPPYTVDDLGHRIPKPQCL